MEKEIQKKLKEEAARKEREQTEAARKERERLELIRQQREREQAKWLAYQQESQKKLLPLLEPNGHYTQILQQLQSTFIPYDESYPGKARTYKRLSWMQNRLQDLRQHYNELIHGVPSAINYRGLQELQRDCNTYTADLNALKTDLENWIREIEKSKQIEEQQRCYLPPKLWEASAYKTQGGYVLDMSSDYWSELPPREQKLYAIMYREGYARAHQLPIEKNFNIGSTAVLMVLIPPGRFWMGSHYGEKRRSSDEKRRKVTIAEGFWMGKQEVTQQQWAEITGETPWKGQQHVREHPLYPAVYISWYDIQRKFLPHSGPVFKLPSESQWEYACRCGSLTSFYWGEDQNYRQIQNYAWYDGNTGDQGFPQRIAGKQPNYWGLFDMSGNVYEWCSDWYQSYSDQDSSPASTEYRGSKKKVGRGGYWFDPPHNCRSAYRCGFPPYNRSSGVGLRLVRSLK